MPVGQQEGKVVHARPYGHGDQSCLHGPFDMGEGVGFRDSPAVAWWHFQPASAEKEATDVMRMHLAVSPLAAEAGVEDHMVSCSSYQFRYDHRGQGMGHRVQPLIDGQVDDIIAAAFRKRMNDTE
jgi:hypothetical protein